MLDMSHELVRLADRVDWSRFEERFGSYFSSDMGRPGVPTRLIVGVHYLKYMFDLSDSGVVQGWRENPYWQYFCGCQYFETKFPFDRSYMTKWRKRVGEDGALELFQETLSVGFKVGALKMRELEELLADTTVQEKHIAYPTDVKLYHKARALLVKLAKSFFIKLRQSYVRKSKQALLAANRYSAARQMKRAKRASKRVHNYLGRVLREVERYVTRNPHLTDCFKDVLALCRRVYTMKDRGEKIYSLHEQDVECIAKGKAHKRYEFGVKVSVMTTAKSGFLISCGAYHGRPYDGHTLKPSLEDANRMVGKELKPKMSVDRGYGGHGFPRGQVVHPNRRRLSEKERKLVRRRSAVEATISLMKRSFRLGRNYLSGKVGDLVNAKLSAAAYNLAKILRYLRCRPAPA